ncbi:MAG: threonyl-tRNA synthetase [Candidatus Parcubacteria bacterium]|jgi:threonyl-tRNA synthetase
MNKPNIEHVRHTLAHLLAAAITELYPKTLLTIGPAVDNGFYYDMDFAQDKDTAVSEKDFPAIEKKMRELLKTWTEFSHKKVSADEARAYFADNPFKLELIEEIVAKGEDITLYTSGAFTDLCRGGHVEHPSKDIDAHSFKLSKIAGAYWRGDEKNKMLSRVYGLAFHSKEELEAYVLQMEEAAKRDHKKIGKEMGLFVFSELVGSGLPLWTPKGTFIREALNDYVWDMRKAKGYQKVTIPHITKKDLYETSGHWAKFADELFKIETREKHLFAMKPMNCPHHTQIYDSAQRSYKDLPQRYCETTMVYRDEQSGELAGLSRVRSITQDDAHVFCREIQIEEEIFAIWDIIDNFYKTFGFNNLQVRFSRHDPESFEKYIGTKETWEKAENQIKAIIEKRGYEYIDGKGEAAMYGPKIDFISKDSIGRTLQVATIQLDFNMPQRFGLTCINEKGEKEQIVMIHCAIMGSIERFMATLIEHLAGNFPLWLSPVQVKIIPIGERQHEYAKTVHAALTAAGLRSELDDSAEGLGKKVRASKVDKLPYWIVIGDKEIEANMVTLESRDKGNLGQMSIEAVTQKLTEENNSKAY